MDPERFETSFDASIESDDLNNLQSTFFESDIPIMETMIDSITNGKEYGNNICSNKPESETKDYPRLSMAF
ncbi:hypothetical protein PIROE2DRAFT_10759 [Piromyces sp. E2]|nr:hypothetical protein PIROE2DRAFT_10759 [Piromyces sp. E2]|eukprot:OUM62838.1 hypothetical protein PIROE2DRAFT_10759 [Piromyces sp. E2]